MELANQGPARELAVFKDFRERYLLLSRFYSYRPTTDIRDDNLLQLQGRFHKLTTAIALQNVVSQIKEEFTALSPRPLTQVERQSGGQMQAFENKRPESSVG
jgi:hypothetical protein